MSPIGFVSAGMMVLDQSSEKNQASLSLSPRFLQKHDLQILKSQTNPPKSPKQINERSSEWTEEEMQWLAKDE